MIKRMNFRSGTYEKVEEEEEEIYEVINVHKLKSATPNLRVINLYGINFIDDSHIDAFSSNCIQLECLAVNYCSKVTGSTMRTLFQRSKRLRCLLMNQTSNETSMKFWKKINYPFIYNLYQQICFHFFFRFGQRIRYASGVGKIVGSRTGYNRNRSLHGMLDRYVGSDTQFEVFKRWPDERFQRYRVKHVHGTGQRSEPNRTQSGLLRQPVGRRALQVFIPLRSSAAGTLPGRYATHHWSAVEHSLACSQQCHVKHNLLFINFSRRW